MTLLAESNGGGVYHADWRVLPVEKCDAVIVDCPYSERTHSGHDDGTASANRFKERWVRVWKTGERAGKVGMDVPADRRPVNYGAWSPADVAAFVTHWHPRCDGWIVTITDHVLAPVWAEALEEAGRYVFAPLAFTAPGSRVRLAGDGPSNWSTWIVVARPKSREFQRWGTLPGAYVLPAGEGGAGTLPVVGGKPLWLMQRLVEDYSRPGALVVDPCCGAGTTLAAALRAGRRAIGGDIKREHADMAAAWIGNPWAKSPKEAHRQVAMFASAPAPANPQPSLFGAK